MKVRWDVEVDEADRLESQKAGRDQFVSVISTTFGPFDTRREAEDAANAVADALPKNFPTKGGR